MNAPLERGPQKFCAVQCVVLFNDIMSGKANEALFAQFSVASKFLPEEAREAWLRVENVSERMDPTKEDIGTLSTEEQKDIQTLKESIDLFSAHLEEYISTFDPDAMSAYTDAVEAGDVDMMNQILEKHAGLVAQNRSGEGE